MVNRKEDQGEEAIKQIKEEVGQDAQIEWKQCDLGNLNMVKEVFTEIAKSNDRLDLVCLSPIKVFGCLRQADRQAHPLFRYQQQSVPSRPRRHRWPLWRKSPPSPFSFRCRASVDQSLLETDIQVNALGHYYAINLLYPLLSRTAKTVPKGGVRIVFESSEMHRFAPGSEDSKERGRGCHFGSEEEITEGGKELGPVELYGRTKLAMILYAKAISTKVIKKNGDNIYM